MPLKINGIIIFSNWNVTSVSWNFYSPNSTASFVTINVYRFVILFKLSKLFINKAALLYRWSSRFYSVPIQKFLVYFFMFMWPCIVTNFFIIKPTRCTNFTNIFWHETLHVSDSSSVHHQEFIHCTLNNGICRTGLKTAFEQDQDGSILVDGSDSRKRFIIRQQSRGTYESVGKAELYLLDEIYQPVSQELFKTMA